MMECSHVALLLLHVQYILITSDISDASLISNGMVTSVAKGTVCWQLLT